MKNIFIFAIMLLLALGVRAQQIKRPDFLKPGDKIAILSPASRPDVKFVTSAEKVLQGWGTRRCVDLNFPMIEGATIRMTVGETESSVQFF